MDNDDDTTVNVGFTAQDIDDLLKCSITTGASGSLPTSGSYFVSTGAGANGTWATNPYVFTTGSTGNVGIGSMSHAGLHVTSDAEFDGDIKWKGRSLGKLLQGIEDRLAIIQEPSPEKLEKFAALKKAYDHYKTLERLIGED
jgi:hypothetical protein